MQRKSTPRSLAATGLALLATLASTAEALASAGDRDPGFGNAGVALTDAGGRDFAKAIARQPDGKLVVVGGTTAGGRFKVRVVNTNDFTVNGTLQRRRFEVAASSRRAVSLRLPKRLLQRLKRKGSLRLRLAARVQDPAGNARTITAQARMVRTRLRGQ